MEGLGFRLSPAHLFVHDRNPYTVEFVPSPVAIGGDVINTFARVSTEFGEVQVLHVHDVVADRLNKYVAYEDNEAFEVAVAVAVAKGVDLERIAAFIERQAADIPYAEQFRSAFHRFRERLAPRVLSHYGFTTAFRVLFQEPPTEKQAQETARALHTLLDENRAAIHPALDGIVPRQTPGVMIDGSHAQIVVDVATKRDLVAVDRFGLAADLVDYARANIALFPELRDIPDEGTPPVATSGL